MRYWILAIIIIFLVGCSNAKDNASSVTKVNLADEQQQIKECVYEISDTSQNIVLYPAGVLCKDSNDCDDYKMEMQKGLGLGDSENKFISINCLDSKLLPFLVDNKFLDCRDDSDCFNFLEGSIGRDELPDFMKKIYLKCQDYKCVGLQRYVKKTESVFSKVTFKNTNSQ